MKECLKENCKRCVMKREPETKYEKSFPFILCRWYKSWDKCIFKDSNKETNLLRGEDIYEM